MRSPLAPSPRFARRVRRLALSLPAFALTLSAVVTVAVPPDAQAVGQRPAWAGLGRKADILFGASVAGAGDVNGDGYGDVLVGASQFRNPLEEQGRAFWYAGSAQGLASAPGWFAESDQAHAMYANAVASAGDVNGDGYDDVVVGAFNYSIAGEVEREGRAYLYLGSPAGPAAQAAWIVEGTQQSENLGTSVAGAGDVNGDGYGDVIVGAPGSWDTELGEGRAFLYLGSSMGVPETAAWRGEANQVDARFGTSVASAGDVNGDGYDDVIVGAPAWSNAQVQAGRVHVYLGSPVGLAATPDWTAEGDQMFEEFGFAVAGAGDVNGDGYDDVVVGARNFTHGEQNEGGAFVFLGSPAGLAAAPVWIGDNNAGYSEYGTAVAGAGDVNADGYDDILIGARYLSDGATSEGGAYLYFGSAAGPSAAPGWTVQGNVFDALLGAAVAGAGDVNGDGYADLAVGAPQFTRTRYQQGLALVFAGSAASGSRAPAGSGSQVSAISTEDALDADRAAAGPAEASTLRLAGVRLARATYALEYSLADAAVARLVILDAIGRQVAVLATGAHSAGVHRALWDGRDVAGARVSRGVYLARLETRGASRTLRILVTR